MPFQSKPLDTSQVELGEELRRLVEVLARQAHETRAERRLSEGWRYGPEKDEINKRDPSLVSYADLPESEKAFLKETTEEILRSLLALGFHITGPSRPETLARDLVERTVGRLKSVTDLDLAVLSSMWKAIKTTGWTESPEVYEILADRFLKAGEPLPAYDVLETGLRHWRGAVRLQQLLAVACRRLGAGDRAYSILRRLYGHGHTDRETLQLLAAVHSDRWNETADPARREKELRESHALYHMAYLLALRSLRIDDALYAGINAAATALLLGNKPRALSIAEDVEAIGLEKTRKQPDYRAEATLAEAALISGEFSEAEKRYLKAVEIAHGAYREIADTRRNARLLLRFLGEEENRFDRCFRIPRIVVPENRVVPFPAGREEKFRTELKRTLSALGEKIGYVKVKSRADIVFCEILLEEGNELHLFLPVRSDIFRRNREEFSRQWGDRFLDVLKKADSVTAADEASETESSLSDFYSDLLQKGSAVLRAGNLDSDVIFVPLPVLSAPPPNDAPEPRSDPEAEERGVTVLLLGEIVGTEGLAEERVPLLLDRLIARIAERASRLGRPPLARKSWGKAFLFAFDSARAAGELALELCDLVRSDVLRESGLPREIGLKTVLHAGLFHRRTNPITGRPDCVGSRLLLSGGIELRTPPGYPYATQAFAALAAAQGVEDFRCEYVGRTPAAAEAEPFPTYYVRRSKSTEEASVPGT